jgi:probable rRNA maturation factor
VNKIEVKRVVKRILSALDSSHLPPHVSEVSVLFCGDDEIQSLNREFRGKDKPTDVLSWALWEGALGTPEPVLGDVVISLETAERQAPKYGTDFPQEIVRLLVHGIHHLLGFEHEGVSLAVARKMRASEERIFAAEREHAELVLK